MLSATTKESAANTASEAKNTVYKAKGDITEMASRAGRQVRNYIDTAGEQLHDARDKVVSEVRTNPVRSSLIALGAGLVLGVLFRR